MGEGQGEVKGVDGPVGINHLRFWVASGQTETEPSEEEEGDDK